MSAHIIHKAYALGVDNVFYENNRVNINTKDLTSVE